MTNQHNDLREEGKDLNYWKKNAEEDYMKVPISVLRYIMELESQLSEAHKQIEALSDVALRNDELTASLEKAMKRVEELQNQIKTIDEFFSTMFHPNNINNPEAKFPE